MLADDDDDEPPCGDELGEEMLGGCWDGVDVVCWARILLLLLLADTTMLVVEFAGVVIVSHSLLLPLLFISSIPLYN